MYNFVYSPSMVFLFHAVNKWKGNIWKCYMYMFVYCYRLTLSYFECFLLWWNFPQAFSFHSSSHIAWLHKKHLKTQKSMKTSQNFFFAKNFENLFVFLQWDENDALKYTIINTSVCCIFCQQEGKYPIFSFELSTCNFNLVKVLPYFVFLLFSQC